MFANIADSIDHHARRRPHHPALIDADATLDWQALGARVRKAARHLQALGVSEGDVIAVALRDHAWHVTLLLAVLRAGGVLLPVDVRWTDAEKRRVIEHFGAAGVLVEPGAVESATVPHWAVDPAFVDAVKAADSDGEFPSHADAPMGLSLSSGTTGTPKGPLLTHRQLVLRFVSQWVSLGFNERDRFMCSMPLYFGGGRNFTLANLFTGATVVLQPPPYEPDELVEAVNAHRITSLFLVPTLLRRLLERAPDGDTGVAFPRLRILISSGALLHAEEHAQVMTRLSPHFFNLYSSTEGGSVAVLPPEAGPALAGSVGQAVYMNEFEIVDADDRPLPPDTVGEIRQRAPWVPAGFHNDPAATARCFRDGWYYPGDLGRVDDAGYLYIVGRSKDMIIRGGVNIYPAEIEATLLEHPDIADAAVVAWPSRELGEEVAAFVICAADTDVEALRAFCATHLARYKVPRRIFAMQEFPRNSSGKVQKTRLAEQLPSLDD